MAKTVFLIKPLPTYPGMLTDSVRNLGKNLHAGTEDRRGIKFYAFHALPKQKFLGCLFFAIHTVTGVVYLDALEEFLMLFWKKTILVTCYSSNKKCLFIFVRQFMRKCYC
jgi:hypothetical protein